MTEHMQIPPVAAYGRRAVDTSLEGDQSTDAIVDAIAKAVAERLSASADGYRSALNWIEVAADPKLAKRTLRGLHDALAAITAAQQRLDADRVAHDEHIAKSNAELEQREKTAGSMWKRANDDKRAVETREERCREREHELGLDFKFAPPGSFQPPAGSTMSQSLPEPPRLRRTEVSHGPGGEPFPPGCSLTMSTFGNETEENPQLETSSSDLEHVAEQPPPARRPGRPRKNAPS